MLALDTCDFVAGSVMSIRSYFRPRNRLPEPTGSISVALKSRDPGTSSPLCARSAGYFLRPVTVPPRHKNCEHTRDTFRGECPMIVPSFFVATTYRSEAFLDSLSHTNDTPTTDIRGVLEYSNSFRKTSMACTVTFSKCFFTLL